MRYALLGVLALVAAAAALVATTGGGESAPAAGPHTHTVRTATPAVELRVTLTQLLSEHALLASTATQRGYSGGNDFPALAKALDRNSVELANTIGSVYGKAARDRFLNGKLLWRDHIRFFVQYTVAKAEGDRAGQRRAVANLDGYVEAFSSFLSGATGLPRPALRASIAEHVKGLKGQIDAYAAGDYLRAYTLERQAARHMVMTGETLTDAIVEKFPARFDG